ncbi:unnamed protein product [Urochloa decumbens]|uniref:Amino acid transporter transmembrane domain-containing protein n=1 Tax=Urochloa decumbens TaxID=240449 RepID=A0ABC8YTU0_9POAL
MEGQRNCQGEAALPVSTLSEPLLSGSDTKGADLATADDLEAAQLPSYGGTSFSRTCLNLTNAVSGIGVLSMPYAVAQGGWASLALFALVGALCYYTGTLIERCMRADPDAIRSYPDIGEFAFGSGCRRAIAFFMYVELYLVAISFLVLEGDNLHKLFPGAAVEFLGCRLQGKQLFIALAAAIVLPTTWLKNLGVLAYVSAVGLVASAALTASLVWAGVAETGFHRSSTTLLNPTGLPTSLGLYFVCFTGHAVFPTIYSSMRNNKHFSKVLLVSSVICSLNYGLTAVLGYMIYGDDVQSQVTLNLPSGKLYTKVAIVMTLVNPLAKYALLAAPITAALEEKFKFKSSLPDGGSSSGAARVAISTAVVVSTAVPACTVPFFGYLMSFIGSFLSVMATVIFPCLCFLKIYKAEGIRRTEIAAIIGILVVGVFVAVTGTYTSLQQIIATF